MSKAIYVGAKTNVPIYKETTAVRELNKDTASGYFSIEYPNDYGMTLDTYASSNYGITGIQFNASNIGVNSSTSGVKLTALVDINVALVLCAYTTETSYDKITLSVAGSTVINGVSGNSSEAAYWDGAISAGDVIEFKYVKDSSQSASGEKAYWAIICEPTTITTTEITGYEDKDIARAVKKMYIGVDGMARKVKKAYIGVGGVAKLFYAAEAFGGYTGDYTVSQMEIDGVAYDLYTLTSSGTLTLNDDAQYWMCGGGEGGCAGTASTTGTGYAIGGFGGGGGYVGTGDIGSGTYAIVIGAGGSGNDREGVNGGATSIDGVASVRGGGYKSDGTEYHSYGGSGGGASGTVDDAGVKAQGLGNGSGITTIPFGISTLKKHCAGGGGGSASYRLSNGTWTYAAGADGGSNGSKGGSSSDSVLSYGPGPSAGGEYGGGKGGSSAYNATAATFYGSAGGGGHAECNDSAGSTSAKTGGAGYQGICYILIPAETA